SLRSSRGCGAAGASTRAASGDAGAREASRGASGACCGSAGAASGAFLNRLKKLNMVSLAEEAGRGAGCAGRRGFVREARRRVRRHARCKPGILSGARASPCGGGMTARRLW
ncbi:hypothetical protein ACRUJW_18690, partial [Burkholderia pseudomallei]